MAQKTKRRNTPAVHYAAISNSEKFFLKATIEDVTACAKGWRRSECAEWWSVCVLQRMHAPALRAARNNENPAVIEALLINAGAEVMARAEDRFERTPLY